MRGNVVDVDLASRCAYQEPGRAEGNGDSRHGLPNLDEPFFLSLEVLFVNPQGVVGAQSSNGLHRLPSESRFLLEQVDLVDGSV